MSMTLVLTNRESTGYIITHILIDHPYHRIYEFIGQMGYFTIEEAESLPSNRAGRQDLPRVHAVRKAEIRLLPRNI